MTNITEWAAMAAEGAEAAERCAGHNLDDAAFFRSRATKWAALRDWLLAAEGVRDAPADSYETSEGVRVRLGEAKDKPQPFKRQVLAAAATMLLDEDSLTVGDDVTDLDGTFVRLVVTSYKCLPPRTYGGILRNVPGWETRLSGFLSRARRALA